METTKTSPLAIAGGIMALIVLTAIVAIQVDFNRSYFFPSPPPAPTKYSAEQLADFRSRIADLEQQVAEAQAVVRWVVAEAERAEREAKDNPSDEELQNAAIAAGKAANLAIAASQQAADKADRYLPSLLQQESEAARQLEGGKE